MNEDKFLQKSEILSLILSSIILGFIFSFREWGYGSTFNFQVGMINLIQASIISMIVLLLYVLIIKIVALRNEAYTKYSIWSIQRYGFKPKSLFKKPVKVGIIIPILLAIISNGFIKFAAVGVSGLKEIRSRRIGRAFKRLTEYQIAVIHLSGPLTLILIATMLSSIETLSKFVLICYSLAIFSMLPFSKLEGSKVFFGSPELYVFSMALMIADIILINIASPLLTLLMSIIIGIVILLIFLHKNN